MSLTQFVERPLAAAAALANGACGGTHIEAYLLASSLLSGLAAYVWPGDGKDKRRFAELWVRFADPGLNPRDISVPLLTQNLRRSGKIAEVEAIERLRAGKFGPGGKSRIVSSTDVDIPEADIQNACPSLSMQDIRRSSYPVIFYEHVRCAIVHEYELSKRATGSPQTVRQGCSVSYSNHLVDNQPGRTERRIHFHVPWVIELIRSIARHVDADSQSAPHPEPTSWWIQG